MERLACGTFVVNIKYKLNIIHGCAPTSNCDQGYCVAKILRKWLFFWLEKPLVVYLGKD